MTMKLLTTTLLIVSLSVASLADKAANFNVKKEKRITKITQRLVKIENRKDCMKTATSLKGMQSCRVEKNRNKPFKTKQNMTFEQRQSKVINRITKRISKISQRKTCIENALNIIDLKACNPKRKAK